MPVIENPKARELDEVPPGHRGLGRCIHETRKSYLFEYFGHELFIPKSVLVRSQGSHWAPAWAIENAKKYNAEQKKAQQGYRSPN